MFGVKCSRDCFISFDIEVQETLKQTIQYRRIEYFCLIDSH